MTNVSIFSSIDAEVKLNTVRYEPNNEARAFVHETLQQAGRMAARLAAETSRIYQNSCNRKSCINKDSNQLPDVLRVSLRKRLSP